MNLCNLCGNSNLSLLINFGQHPIAHRYLLTNSSQEEYVHPVELYFCESCGLIQLMNPIPAELLYKNYVTLSSWKNQPHIPHEIKLIEDLPGINKTSRIVEVGCNDGTFSRVLLDSGYREVLGIEPALDAIEAARQKGVKIVGGYFNVEMAKNILAHYDRFQLFIARQVLEHISDLRSFREALQLLLVPGGFVMIEVPNFACNLATGDYTLWEEHVNYFTLDTLKFFLSEAGIYVLHSENILFSGESLVITGQYAETARVTQSLEYLDGLRAQVLSYCKRWPLFRKALVEFLSNYQQNGGKVAIYGAGARICSLINFTGIGSYIECIVDDQLEKQGKYMPGSRLPILPSEALEQQNITLCLLAVNTENEEKVIAKHSAWQQRGGKFFSVYPPSDKLLPIWHKL